MNDYTFDTTFTIPNSLGCVINGINMHGNIVGVYLDNSGNMGSFLKIGSSIYYLSYPGSALTFAQGIDDNNNVYGDFKDSLGAARGFKFDGITYSAIDAANASATYITNCNGSGVLVGIADLNTGSSRRGCIMDTNGTVTILTVPNSIENALNGIGKNNTAVGLMTSAALYKNPIVKPGDISVYMLPGKQDAGATAAYGISETRDEIIGQWYDYDPTIQYHYNPDRPHGFVYKDSAYYDFYAPDSVYTAPVCINDAGVIVGFFDDVNGNRKPFIATPKA